MEFRFIKGNIVPASETNTIEFKNKSHDSPGFAQELSIIISGFMNTEGGKVYYGIADNGTVNGIKLTNDAIDKFRLSVDNVSQNMIHYEEKKEPIKVSVTFHQVYNSNNSILVNVFVVEISVSKKEFKYDVCSHNGMAYIRAAASFRQKSTKPLFVNLGEYEKLQREIEEIKKSMTGKEIDFSKYKKDIECELASTKKELKDHQDLVLQLSRFAITKRKEEDEKSKPKGWFDFW